jgi:hypothetical protein
LCDVTDVPDSDSFLSLTSVYCRTFERPPFNNLDMNETGMIGGRGASEDRSKTCRVMFSSTPCFIIETDLPGLS